MTKATSPYANHRKLFRLLIVFAALLALEFSSFLIARFRYGSVAQMEAKRKTVAASDPVGENANWTLPVVPHPYLGAILPPTDPSVRDMASINSYGFFGTESPIQPRRSDKCRVAVVGGSVARQMVGDARQILIQELQKCPALAGRQVQIVPLAADGYKQPQQLMTIMYLSTLGAEFDVIVNLDGLNEIALPAIDNIPNGVFASFPRNWAELSSRAGSAELRRILGYSIYLRMQNRDRAKFFSQPLVRWSPTMMLTWQILGERNERLIAELTEDAGAIAQDAVTYGVLGPRQEFDRPDDLFDHCVDVWLQSSVLLHQLCKARKTAYFHFLQPNQYVPDSKTMSFVESRDHVSDDSPFREPVLNYYPLMQARAEALAKAGVHFTDLTQIFSDTTETIYRDDCCHVNSNGSERLARRVATVVSTSLQNLSAK